MKINQILVESEQLDELSGIDVARGLGSAIGKTANAVGGIAGAAKGAWDAGKAGYNAGQNFVSGQRVGGYNPQAKGVASPHMATQAGGNLSQMKDNELVTLKGQIDGVLQSRNKAQPVSPVKPVQQTPQPQATNAPINPSVATKTPKVPTIGQQATSSDGQTYEWKGAAWINTQNKRIAPRAISAELTQQVSQGNGVPSRDNRVGFPNKKVPNISVAGGETGKAPSIRAVGEEFHSKFLGRMI